METYWKRCLTIRFKSYSHQRTIHHRLSFIIVPMYLDVRIATVDIFHKLHKRVSRVSIIRCIIVEKLVHLSRCHRSLCLQISINQRTYKIIYHHRVYRYKKSIQAQQRKSYQTLQSDSHQKKGSSSIYPFHIYIQRPAIYRESWNTSAIDHFVGDCTVSPRLSDEKAKNRLNHLSSDVFYIRSKR